MVFHIESVGYEFQSVPADSVENQKNVTENHGVGGSIPPLGTIYFK